MRPGGDRRPPRRCRTDLRAASTWNGLLGANVVMLVTWRWYPVQWFMGFSPGADGGAIWWMNSGTGQGLASSRAARPSLKDAVWARDGNWADPTASNSSVRVADYEDRKVRDRA